MSGLLKVVHLMKRFRRVEAVAVATTTTAASTGLSHIDIPSSGCLDKLGMLADLIAGAFFAAHTVMHWLEHRQEVRHA